MCSLISMCILLFVSLCCGVYSQKLELDETVVQAPFFTPNFGSNVSLHNDVNSQLLPAASSQNTSSVPSSPSSPSTGHNLVLGKPEVIGIDDQKVIVQWQYDMGFSSFRAPHHFAIEFAEGKYSEEYVEIDRFEVYVNTLQDTIRVQRYVLDGLSPTTWYRIRVIPIFHSGPGFPSDPLTITTLRSPTNYWEPLLARRSSLLSFGRGFSDPVQDRPHLSPGVEIFENQVRDKELPLWFSDSPNRESPVLPSGRRGHSMTLIDDNLFMFGGRTNGYSCASTIIDTLDLGNYDSGRTIYPCVKKHAEVDEIWRLDANTFTWVFINTTNYNYMNPAYNKTTGKNVAPPAREQHSAALLAGNLFIFGGKSRLHDVDSLGFPVLTNKTDVVYNDLWMLQVEHAKTSTFQFRNFSIQYETNMYETSDGKQLPYEKLFNATREDVSSFNSTLFQEKRNVFPIDTYSVVNQQLNHHGQYEGESPRYGQCIDDITIKVRLRHPCVNQLRMSITGPGPSTGSPNFFPVHDSFEVRLIGNILSNSTNCVGGIHEFVFNDAFEDKPSTMGRDIPFRDENSNNLLKPAGKLSEFQGSTHASTWSLIVEDMSRDTLMGELLDWEITFVTSPCYPSYFWTPMKPLTSNAIRPPARYNAKMISHEHSLFVFGGRDVNDNVLQDLYRFDYFTKIWTSLTPKGFYNSALDPSSSVGSNMAMTPWGLIRFGGYYRQRYMSNIYNTRTGNTDNGGSNPSNSNVQRNGERQDDRFIYQNANNPNHKYYNSFTNQDSSDVSSSTLYTHDEQRGNIYENTMLVMDPVTMRWQGINISIVDHPHLYEIFHYYEENDHLQHTDYHMYKNHLFPYMMNKEPIGRYLSSMTFIPSSAMKWHQAFANRLLYDANRASYQANYQNTVGDSIIIFGGFDAAVGSISDGSSGGFLSDLWILRLNQISATSFRESKNRYIESNCKWRMNPSAQNNFGTSSCLHGSTGTNCQFRDLLMLIWCSQHNQTIV